MLGQIAQRPAQLIFEYLRECRCQSHCETDFYRQVCISHVETTADEFSVLFIFCLRIITK